MLRRIRPNFIRSLATSSPIHPGSGLTEDQSEWLNAAHKWGEAELAPFTAEWDKNSFFPVDTLKVKNMVPSKDRRQNLFLGCSGTGIHGIIHGPRARWNGIVSS